MTPNDKREPKLIHVRHPLRRVKLTFKPIIPSDEPVTDGPPIHVAHPLRRATLTFEPVEPAPASLEAAHPADAPQGERAFGTLSAVVGKMNETESLYNRPGVRVDTERSGVRDGKVVIVLAPNDPTDAVETCERVAHYLFAAIRTIPGATVRVMVAGQPDKVLG